MLISLFLFIFSVEAKTLNQKAVSASSSSSGKNVKELVLKEKNTTALSKTTTQEEQAVKDYLVEKLNYLNKMLPKDHKARRAINLRRAHILSLKAEENFMKAERENCKSCEIEARSDAKKSLSIYTKMDSILSTYSMLHTESLFKQAYLHRFLGEKSKSLKALKRVIAKKGIDPLLITRAWFNMGEIYFELYNYKKSLQAFNKVLKKKQSPWRFKAFYRKIWSLSNLSLYEQSVNELESFLKSKLYSNLSGEEQKLKQKLEKELTVLYSYAKVTDKRLAFLYDFSKQDQNKNTPFEKNKRLSDLAQALSRMGQVSASNKVWKTHISKTSSLEDKLKAQFFIVNNDLIVGKTNYLKITGQKLEKIFLLQQKTKPVEDFKQKLKKQAKIVFNRISEKQADFSLDQKKRLLILFKKYNSIYPKDVDILFSSASLAVDLKQYALAQDLFQTAVLNIDFYNNKKIPKAEIKEMMSIGQMEMAELTKDKQRRLRSYDFYIQHGISEDLIFKAKYQKTYIGYEDKDYETSANLFTKLALYKAKNKNLNKLQALRLKAAHLSLSSLDQLGGQEEQLAQKAGLFMKEFPQNRKEFVRIYHAALLNTVKKLVSNKDFSHRPVQASIDKNVLKAWSVLKMVSVKEATGKEALTYHFNQLLLAKELLKFKPMDQSLQFLLTNKNLKKEDRKTALIWKLWLAELRFDFKEVLRIMKILRPEDQSEEHLLRLSRLAELAGQSPIPYYKIFIKKFPKSQSTVAVVTSLIRKSAPKDKRNFLKEYSTFFKNQPNKLTYLVLKTDKGRLEDSFIQPFVSLPFMKNSPLALFLNRKKVIESFEKDLTKVVSYSISMRSSGRRLRQSLKDYTYKINQLGNQANEALKTGDWTVRVFVVSHWEKEISRFYNSVMNLPLPKNLTKEEEQQYKKLLKEQMQIYERQIAQLQEELKLLWSRDFIADYRKGLEQDKVFYGPLKWEMQKLSMVSKEEDRKQIQVLLASIKMQSHKLAEGKKVQTHHLYKLLKQNPFDQRSLMELLNLEKNNNNEALSYYLVNRIKELKKKNKWIRL